jgi:endoglycosylceramidase
VLSLVACPPAEPGTGVAPEGPAYRVADGALWTADEHVLNLRGVNLHEDAKWSEGHLVPLDAEERALLAASGFNSVRMLTFWSAITPSPGVVDDGYLDALAAEVEALASDGLYIVLDMHQDLWGAPFGNGAPSWACPDELKEGYEGSSPWWTSYFSDQVSSCFDRFWDREEARAPLTDAWQAVASRLCHVDRLVGFDLMNEPWPGTRVGEPAFDQAILYERFYSPLMDAIDEACPGRVFFLEPSRAFDFGLSDAMVFADDDRDRVVLASHYYPPSVHEPEGEGYDGDRAAIAADLDRLYAGYLADGVPLWFGEWGGISDVPGFDRYTQDLLAVLAERRAGSALWAWSRGGGFSFLDDAGVPKPELAAITRLPFATLLPSPLREQTVGDDGSLRVVFDCVVGRRVEVVTARGGAAMVNTAPEGALHAGDRGGLRWVGACAIDGEVELVVAAEGR